MGLDLQQIRNRLRAGIADVKTLRQLPRRERCHHVGHRAAKLDSFAATVAWRALAFRVARLDQRDVPKFNELLAIIRTATIVGKKLSKPDFTFKRIRHQPSTAILST